MITNFSDTIKADAQALYHFGSDVISRKKSVTTLDRKIICAAVRILAACAMFAAVASGLSAATGVLLSPIGAVFGVAHAVASYVFAHDVFVILRNKDEPGNTLSNKTPLLVSIRAYTKGTILIPLAEKLYRLCHKQAKA